MSAKEHKVNIFVGNLPFQTTDEELMSSFGEYGEVTSAQVITDRYSGRSRGFGFVEMPNHEQAEAAIKEMNGRMLGGRPLTVNEARPRQPGGGGGGGRGGDRGGDRGGRFESRGERW